ncbi:MAG: SDR family oxidoreductase [Lachnospiraceae bacterium]|nr:SDR family oxidoreductase [Lachnospiraceae bacterium]
MNFDGKVVVVTGASSGMGKSCAEMLLNNGAVVCGFDVNEGCVEHANYRHFQGSVVDEEMVETSTEKIVQEFGRVDGLVNAAGVWGNSKPFFDMDTADFQRILNVNTVGAFVMSKYISKIMIPKKNGKIVNISCIRSTIFRGNMADYAASKGAIVSLTSAMALDLAPFNIQVNAVAPGFIYTGMTKASFDNPEIKKQSEELIPCGRVGVPEDIASVVMFLLSDMSNYMTGTNVFADGGYHIQK